MTCFWWRLRCLDVIVARGSAQRGPVIAVTGQTTIVMASRNAEVSWQTAVTSVSCCEALAFTGLSARCLCGLRSRTAGTKLNFWTTDASIEGISFVSRLAAFTKVALRVVAAVLTDAGALIAHA